jgi:class 3 adenylate cyclase
MISVNVAARLEQLCEPGGVPISGTAYDHLQGKIGLALDYRGEQQVMRRLATQREQP